jgi:hypothetical protein
VYLGAQAAARAAERLIFSSSIGLSPRKVIRVSGERRRVVWPIRSCSSNWNRAPHSLALQLSFLTISGSMGNHDSKIVDAGSVD